MNNNVIAIITDTGGVEIVRGDYFIGALLDAADQLNRLARQTKVSVVQPPEFGTIEDSPRGE